MVAMQRMVQLSVSTSAAATSSYGVSSSCKGVEVVISNLFADGLRDLVVDDDITCLRILEEMLRRCLYIEFVVYLLDKTIASSAKGREIGNERLSGILDLQQVTYKNVDARGLIAGFQFLQAYFPERLAKCYILHMPRFFVSIWRMGSRFIEKATLEKIVVVINEDEKKSFIEEIGEEAVPVEYGGKAKLTAIQDVEVPPLEG